MTYTATYQAATRFHVDLGGGIVKVICCPPHARRRALCCGRRRTARNLYAQVYHDGFVFTCRPGRGCKR